MDSMLGAIDKHLARRTGEQCISGAILFSGVYGDLGHTRTVSKILAMLSQIHGKEQSP